MKTESMPWLKRLPLNRSLLPSCFALALILFPSTGNAQNAPSTRPAPPPPPYVGTLKGDFTFVKKIIYKTSPPVSKLTDAQQSAMKALSPTPDIKELDAVGKGTLRRDRQFFVDGTSMEIWRSGSNRFLVNLANPDYIEVAAASPEGYQDVPDFKELDWISAGSFQGEQSLQGKMCYVYRQGDRAAWIEKSSNLPVFFDSISIQVSYSYQGPPSEPLQLPDKFVKRMRQISRASAGLPPN